MILKPLLKPGRIPCEKNTKIHPKFMLARGERTRSTSNLIEEVVKSQDESTTSDSEYIIEMT